MTEARFWRYVRRGLLALLGIFLAWKLRQTLQLVAIALFLAGAISPVVQEMERWKISRSWAVGILYLGLLVVLMLTLAPAPRLVTEVGQFLVKFPDLLRQIQVPDRNFFGLTPQEISDFVQSRGIWEPLQTLGQELAGQTVNFTVQVLNGLGLTLLSLLLTWYFVVNAEVLLHRVLAPFPPSIQAEVRLLLPPICRCLGAYVLGKLGTSILLGFCTYLILVLLQVSFAGALGLLVAVSNLVPFIGPVLGLIPMVLVAWNGGLLKIGAVVTASFVLQQIEAWVLQPWLVGPYLNLDPFELLMSLLVGAELFGVLGALIAPPVAGIGKILFLHYRNHPRFSGATASEETDWAAPPPSDPTSGTEADT
ncbi:MAG: AI-2E family transporter [Pseudanabaenaceae cyanobacterium]